MSNGRTTPKQAAPDTEIGIRIVDPGTGGAGRPTDAWILDQLRTVATKALAPDQQDDRFQNWTPPDRLVLAVALAEDEPIGYLGGGIDRGRLQLDGLIDRDRADGSGGPLLGAAMYQALGPSIEKSTAETIEFWGKPASAWHRITAERNGFDELRALHQLRCSLPVDAAALDTRPFVPGRDEENLLLVNNRAFASHPDQGNLTMDDLEEAAAQPWFDPEGIRLFDDPDHPSRLAGFCWTKVHEPLVDGQPRLGEIYAIGIDPDHHGKGLGVPMTAAGLAWLAGLGLTNGMLYVEADNAPALRTYEKLGFEIHRTDRAWSKRNGGKAGKVGRR